MDAYIRNYNVPAIDTVVAEDILKMQTILLEGNSFNLFHNNIRDLQKNFDKLQVLLHSLDYAFECVFLTENRKVYNFDIMQIQGYDVIYNEGDINYVIV